MQRPASWVVGLSFIIIMLAGCGLATEHDTPGTEPTYTIAAIPTDLPSVTPPLETITEPYENAGVLLDGVCFEFLYSLDGDAWVWTTPGDLVAFYDRADESELCPAPVSREDFDFSERYLVGAVQVTSGCDAAHHVIDTVTDDAARTQTIVAQLMVSGTCDYDLVQPLLIAVPRPAEGYTLQIALMP